MCFRASSAAPATARASRPAAAAASRKTPVAICRLKRVAADYKDDVTRRMPQAGAQKNGKRIACVGARPRLADGGARPGAAGLSTCIDLRRRRQGRRHDAHARSRTSACRKR